MAIIRVRTGCVVSWSELRLGRLVDASREAVYHCLLD